MRAASGHPDRGRSLFPDDAGGEWVRADINDENSANVAVSGAFAVVNAVSLYVERGRETFHSVHVDAAAGVARIASGARRGAPRANLGNRRRCRFSPLYIRSRGEGEAAVLREFSSATLIRPAVMFGPDDTFLVPLVAMLRRFLVFSLFGSGETKLQPAYVEDVAEAVARVLQTPAAYNVYALAGPRVYTYRELLQMIAAQLNREPLLVPFPFAL